MPSNNLILCHPLLLPSIFPRIRVFSNESVLCIRWPKYYSLMLIQKVRICLPQLKILHAIKKIVDLTCCNYPVQPNNTLFLKCKKSGSYCVSSIFLLFQINYMYKAVSKLLTHMPSKYSISYSKVLMVSIFCF